MNVFRKLAYILSLGIFTSYPQVFTLEESLISEEAYNWFQCSQFPIFPSNFANCFCFLEILENDQEIFKLNCDGVGFLEDFPRFLPKPLIYDFSWKNAMLQNIPPQVFLPSGIPLEKLDLSRNNLRRLNDKSLQGLSETLEILDLSENLLGDQLNPIFSTQEFNRLPRLRKLMLSRNGIRRIDHGILQGAISLQSLDLSGNELYDVPKDALTGPKALRSINLSKNFIQEISRDDFSKQKSLVYINLRSNQINTIFSGAFNGLRNLKFLDLSFNHFEKFNSDALNGLSALEELSLAENFLTEIPRVAISQLITLRKLNVSANLLRNLSSEDFGNLKRITELSLSRNRLTIIPDNVFQRLKSLEFLDLSVNQLRTIPKRLFEGLQLKTLDLSDNNLLLFPMESLQKIKGLETLSLDFNRISAIQEIPNLKLIRLSLANNLIRLIPSKALEHLSKLEVINLHGNQIPTSTLEELDLPQALVELNISRNNITLIPRFHLPNLQSLDVSWNHVKTILPHNFLLLSALENLRLEHNEIFNVSTNAFEGLYNLTYLNLSTNEIPSSKTFTNLPPMRSLDVSNNLLTSLHDKFFQHGEFLMYLNLRGNKLNSFRGLHGDFPNLQEISFANNQISYVFPQAFENMTGIRNLDFSSNQLTFFPTDSLPRSIESLSIAKNLLRHIHEVSFANLPSLRSLDLQSNSIETLPTEPFTNSSQLSNINLASNKIEEFGENFFNGLLKLNLNVSNNFISYLPAQIFGRGNVHRLYSIDLSFNSFIEIPTVSLQPQIFYLESLNIGSNKISIVQPNSNVLVNVKHLDMSNNPLTQESSFLILNEPKTTRTLKLRNANVSTFPIVEIPFLRSLDLHGNHLRDISSVAFKRTTLLEHLDLSGNPLDKIPEGLPLTLRSLDMSNTFLDTLKGSPFPANLQILRLNHIHTLSRLEKSVLKIPFLTEIEIFDSPKLGYIDVRGILSSLRFLEKFDFELKDTQILDQIHPALSPRLKFIGLRGKSVKTISTGTLAGLASPIIEINLSNTSLSTLPPILVPVPASSFVTIDISDSTIKNLSPPFLSSNIRITGINPHCDCQAQHLINYLKSINSPGVCSSPPALKSIPVLHIQASELLCSNSRDKYNDEMIPLGSISIPSIRSSASHSSTNGNSGGHRIMSTTKRPKFPITTIDDDIIWSVAPTSSSSQSKFPSSSSSSSSSSSTNPTIPKTQGSIPTMDTNAMDNLILGVVGGVITLLLIFIVTLICCLRRSGGRRNASNPQRKNQDPTGFSGIPTGSIHSGKCTCKSPVYPGHTMRSHQSLYFHPQASNHLSSLQPIHLGPEYGTQVYASLPYFLQYDEGMPPPISSRR